MRYFQCRLRQGSAETIGWIEERGAKKGARVELTELGGLWRVMDVWHPGLDATELRAKQDRDRDFLSGEW